MNIDNLQPLQMGGNILGGGVKRKFSKMEDDAAEAEMINYGDEGASSSQTMVLCCVCGVTMPPNPSSRCAQCLRNEIDITDVLVKNVCLPHCKECGRYL